MQNMTSKVEQLVKRLNLTDHPEGGFYKEIYRSKDIIKPQDPRYNNEERCASTIIYYLLGGNDFSAWHKVNSDESWQFCSGSSLTINIIGKDGKLQKIKIGDPLIEEDAVYQYTIPNGLWFCAAPNANDKFSLVTCSVSPGFDFKDWELANRIELANLYPNHEDLIEKYTRVLTKTELNKDITTPSVQVG